MYYLIKIKNKINLFSTIQKSKKHITARNIFIVLEKKEQEAAWWPRLTAEKVKAHWLKTDFNLWKDEDEVDDEEDPMAGMPQNLPPRGAGGKKILFLNRVGNTYNRNARNARWYGR